MGSVGTSLIHTRDLKSSGYLDLCSSDPDYYLHNSFLASHPSVVDLRYFAAGVPLCLSIVQHQTSPLNSQVPSSKPGLIPPGRPPTVDTRVSRHPHGSRLDFLFFFFIHSAQCVCVFLFFFLCAVQYVPTSW